MENGKQDHGQSAIWHSHYFPFLIFHLPFFICPERPAIIGPATIRTFPEVRFVSYAEVTMRDPGTAAVLSFFIPGVGQIYNGKILRGIFWLIVTPGVWIGTGGWFGWVCHTISACTAYWYARRHPIG
jgi:hypothetical protein